MSTPPLPGPSSSNKNPFVWLVGSKVRSRSSKSVTIGRDRGALYIFEWAAIIVIIGTVLTIGLPAYKRAAGEAHAVACSSNLQHLYQMTAMYSQDYDGVYMPLPREASFADAVRPVQKNPDAWTELLRPYREEKKKEKLDPFACPGADDDVMTYAYNAALGAHLFPEYDPLGPPRNESEIRVASQTYLVWDTANRGAANAIVGYRYYSGHRRDGAYRIGDLVLPTRAIRQGWMYPRHNGSASVLFCDGHVNRLSDPNIRIEQKRNPFDPLADTGDTEPIGTNGLPKLPDPLATPTAASPSPTASPAK